MESIVRWALVYYNKQLHNTLTGQYLCTFHLHTLIMYYVITEYGRRIVKSLGVPNLDEPTFFISVVHSKGSRYILLPQPVDNNIARHYYGKRMIQSEIDPFSYI